MKSKSPYLKIGFQETPDGFVFTGLAEGTVVVYEKNLSGFLERLIEGWLYPFTLEKVSRYSADEWLVTIGKIT